MVDRGRNSLADAEPSLPVQRAPTLPGDHRTNKQPFYPPNLSTAAAAEPTLVSASGKHRPSGCSGLVQLARSVEDLDSRLARLGIELPQPRPPLATYVPLRVANNRAYVSGHGPLGENGRPELTGQLGVNLSDDDAASATRTTVLNLLASLRDGLDDLERVAGISQMRCFVVALPGKSSAHSVVAETAGRIFGEVFPGRPIARATTIGVDSCALGLPVTIDLIVEVDAAPV